MWNNRTRGKYVRDHLRYASDLSNKEWAVIEPLLPERARTGRPRSNLRRVLDGLFYVLRSGCQ